MYAVIATGGKQYKVTEGQTLKIESLGAEAGDAVEFDKVLLVADGDNVSIGTPYLDGSTVSATVASNGRHKKVEIVKFKRRKHHRKQMGHRQNFTEVEITAIAPGTGGSSKAAAKSKPAAKEAAPKTEAPVAEAPKTEAATGALFTSGPIDGNADDLKLISGVGPVLEGKLNDLGIYNFSQIAAFTKDEIAMVDERLSFKGRIEREDWLGQAKKLAEGSDS